MADLDHLLQRTSRTFALTIPALPEPTRREVTLAYLLFRLADTFEDAARWPRGDRLVALDAFVALLTPPEPDAPRVRALTDAWVTARPVDHDGYLELLAETPAVLAASYALPVPRRDIVLLHARRTAEGMARVVTRGSARGDLHLTDLADLRAYCYVVAGIVGELLTDLFVAETPRLAAAVLRDNAVAFGEGLQLVNILKDARDDALEGRVYLPTSLPRAEVFALAREDLTLARGYVLALQDHGAPRGVVAFCAIPVLLAVATLDAVERHGPGAKVPRDAVLAMVRALDERLDRALPALP
ncbi:MAG: squalene/phytoene synthase family protein [Deltaproteobacteria bacterium]|nr:squalene/phytoene synthase family protein [Deltaproteobacteria bacterium]